MIDTERIDWMEKHLVEIVEYNSGAMKIVWYKSDQAAFPETTRGTSLRGCIDEAMRVASCK